MNNPFRSEEPILNGEYILVTEDNEFRMSHWVKGFGILHAKTKQWIIELNSSFDLQEYQEKEKALHVRFRVYPNGNKAYDAVLYLFDQYYLYNETKFPMTNFNSHFKELANKI